MTAWEILTEAITRRVLGNVKYVLELGRPATAPPEVLILRLACLAVSELFVADPELLYGEFFFHRVGDGEAKWAKTVVKVARMAKEGLTEDQIFDAIEDVMTGVYGV